MFYTNWAKLKSLARGQSMIKRHCVFKAAKILIPATLLLFGFARFSPADLSGISHGGGRSTFVKSGSSDGGAKSGPSGSWLTTVRYGGTLLSSIFCSTNVGWTQREIRWERTQTIDRLHLQTHANFFSLSFILVSSATCFVSDEKILAKRLQDNRRKRRKINRRIYYLLKEPLQDEMFVRERDPLW